MNKLSQLGRNNPLWRRVQRHAQMSAIFAPPTAVSNLKSATRIQPTTSAGFEPWDAAQPAVPASQPSHPASPPVQPTPQRTDSAETAVPNSPLATTNELKNDEKDDNVANWHRLLTIMQRHQQKRAAEQTAVIDAESIQREVDMPGKPATPNKADVTTDAVPQDESPLSASQAVPLEAAWPVQRKPAEAPNPTNQPTAIQRDPLPKKEVEQINQNLSNVAPGRLTQSPIETILPSRPRPQPKAIAEVQRQPVNKREEAKIEPTIVKNETETAVPHMPKLVKTEIGPLPTDLWETLGDQPPAAPGESPAASISTEIILLDDQSTAAPQKSIETAKEQLFPTPSTSNAAHPATEQDIETALVKPTANMILAKPVSQEPITRQTKTTPQPITNVQGEIQWQATETAVPQPQIHETITEPANKVALSPKRTEPVAKHAAISVKPVQTEPTPPAKSTIQAKATTVLTTPIMQTIPLPAAWPTTIFRKTAVVPQNILPQQPAVKSEKTNKPTVKTVDQPNHQPTLVPPTTVIQRLPDTPTMPEPVTESPTATLTEMMPEAATAVQNEIAPAETEEAPNSQEEIDIDTLSRRVYQQLKRKLAVEWERGYGR